jgi:large subunit ribosomal protein L17
MRMALRMVRDRDAVLKLFEEIAPRFLLRHGGYTRLMQTDQRPGDAAPMGLLELIPAEGGEAAEPKTSGKGKEGKEPKEAGEAKTKGKKAAAEGKPAKAPKAKAAAPKAKREASGGRAPAKSAATMKRSSSRGRGGGE